VRGRPLPAAVRLERTLTEPPWCEAMADSHFGQGTGAANGRSSPRVKIGPWHGDRIGAITVQARLLT
ncbi:MAG: hypothetical protein ACRD7E_02220, partial [Bryobacteraceae bacterium]